MKKILSILLILTLTISLSSCLLLDDEFFIPDEDKGSGGGNVFNVEGGDTNNIEINIEGESTVAAASKGLLSTVSVYCGFTKRGYGLQSENYSSAGAGVIYKLDKNRGEAYVITNYHVVYDAYCNTSNRISNDISLYLYGMEATKYAIPATYVGGSMYYDLAVLKVEASEVLMASEAVAVSVANSDEISILDTAIAIGNPEGIGISATVGHVNVDSETISISMTTQTGTTTQVSLRCVRIDAAVNSGNSGGGLYNNRGELIGIVNAKLADTTVDNIGYAIPSNVARAVADNIIYYCDNTAKESVYRCMLGIEVGVTELSVDYDEASGKIEKKEVISVTNLDYDSAVRGLIQKGDLINSITINGVKHDVTRIYHITDTMLDARPDSTVIINVTRGGESVDVEVPMAAGMLEAY